MIDGELYKCCACGKEDATVRNIVMLDKKAPVAGKGWGCFVCGLPNDGASAILCDDCLEKAMPIQYVFYGYMGEKNLVPVGLATEEFHHDLSKHTELQ